MSNYTTILVEIIQHKRDWTIGQVADEIKYSRQHLTKAMKNPSLFPDVLKSLILKFPEEAKEAAKLTFKPWPIDFENIEVYLVNEPRRPYGNNMPDDEDSPESLHLKLQHQDLRISNLHENQQMMLKHLKMLIELITEKMASGNEELKKEILARFEEPAKDQKAESVPPPSLKLKPFKEKIKKKKKNNSQPDDTHS